MASTSPLKKHAQVSGWRNNCSFNCLTHFLVEELGNTSEDNLTTIENDPGYQKILQIFSDYYNVKPAMTAKALKKLFTEYTNPLDREVILGPVLRRLFVKELYDAFSDERNRVRIDLINELSADMRDYFRYQQNPNLTLYRGNPNLFAAYKEEIEKSYQEFLAQAKNTQALSIEEFCAQNAEKILVEDDFSLYLNRMGEYNTLVEQTELIFLAQKLGISVHVSASDIKNNLIDMHKPDGHPDRLLHVFFNQENNHWEYEASSEDLAAEHNRYYGYYNRLYSTGSVSNSIGIEGDNLTPKFLTAFMPTDDPEGLKQLNIKLNKDIHDAATNIMTADLKTAAEQKPQKQVRFSDDVAYDKAAPVAPKKEPKSILKKTKTADVEPSATVETPTPPSTPIPASTVTLIPTPPPTPAPIPQSSISPSPPTTSQVGNEPLQEQKTNEERTATTKAMPTQNVPPATVPAANVEYTKTPMLGMYSAYRTQAVKAFQKPADAELSAKADSKEKIVASNQWLEEQLKEGNKKRRLDVEPHPFEDVKLSADSTPEKTTLLVPRTDGGDPDTVMRTIDAKNNISARLSHNAEDRAFVILALSNVHFAPMTLKKNNNPKKVLKAMEAFLLAGVPLNIGENKQHFENPTCPEELKDLYLLLSENNGENFKKQLDALTPEERAQRKFGEPIELTASKLKNSPP